MKSLLLSFVFLFLINGCESNDEKAIDLKKGKKAWEQGNEATFKYDYILAFKYYKKSCEENYARGCSDVADAYEFGNKHILGIEAGISVDKELSDKYYRKSADLYKKECKLDNAYACNSVAYFYKEGYGLEKNQELSKEYYLKSGNVLSKKCSLNDSNSCKKLSKLYRKGYGYSKNQSLALKFYNRYIDINTNKCNAGNIEKCEILISESYKEKSLVTLSSLNVKPIYNKVLAYYSDTCNKNHAKSCARLADYLKDEKKAKQLYIKACDLHNGDACYTMYHLFYQAKGKFRTLDGIKFLEKSCENDSMIGCSMLGIVTHLSNPIKSLKAYKKACQLGDGLSCYDVGNKYYYKDNEVEANKFYKKGCDLRDRFSCKAYKEKKEDCTEIKKKFLSCVNRKYQGLECLPNTNIVLPKRCK